MGAPASLRLGLVALLITSTALAHGRPAFLGQLRIDPSNPDRLVARGTWGLAISEDRGLTWQWSCAAAMSVDPTVEDPDILVLSDGSIAFAGFAGVGRSDPDGCDWSFPDPQLRDQFVTAIAAQPGASNRVYALLSASGQSDRLFSSTDGAHHFEPVGAPIDDIRVDRVVPSTDPAVLYLSGAVPRGTDGLRHAFILRSRDGGQTFEPIEMPLEGDERSSHVLAVDPTNPNRIFVRMARLATDRMVERLLLSEDGGDNFITVLTAHAFSAAAITPDGRTVYVASSADEGLFRSDDGGANFALIADKLSIRCLTLSGADELWMCVDQLTEGFSVGVTRTGGVTIDEMMHLDQLYEPLDCPHCSEVGYVCPAWALDLAVDLRLDAGVPLDYDAMTGIARDASLPAECRPDAGLDAGLTIDAGALTPAGGGCACRLGMGTRSGATFLLLALLALRRRRI